MRSQLDSKEQHPHGAQPIPASIPRPTSQCLHARALRSQPEVKPSASRRGQMSKHATHTLFLPLAFVLCCALCWRRQWHPTPVLLPGKSHGWRSLVGCSPRGREESDATERPHFHFSLSSIREGNGNPVQCSCLENPRDGGACWAAIYGVAQSWTRLKRLSSSSSSALCLGFSSFLSSAWLRLQ